MTRYDIAIIGSGPGGYVAALYAAGFGKKAVVVEKDLLGGVCLNWGCIPTKTLIASVKVLDHIKRSKGFGIDVSSYGIDYKAIKMRKDNVVGVLRKGIESLFKAKRIELRRGFGRLADKNVVDVDGDRIGADNIIIATGSSPMELADFKFDKKRILSSADMLDIESLPKKLLIVGGGVNGCEYAYIYSSLGVEVTIVEMMDRLLPSMDRELSKNMELLLKKLGVEVKTKTRLNDIPSEYDKIVVCVGRKPNTEDIGLNELDIKLDRGRVVVDERLKTSLSCIYAIGDAIGGHLLAHVASHEGITACDNIMGKDIQMDYEAVPLCIYTQPQIASVGLTNDKARERGYDVRVSKFPFRALGKSHAMGETEGFLKVIADNKNDEILGIHILGSEAASLIAEATILVKERLRVKRLCEYIHAHPTFSEAFTEAAFLSRELPIHTI